MYVVKQIRYSVVIVKICGCINILSPSIQEFVLFCYILIYQKNEGFFRIGLFIYYFFAKINNNIRGVVDTFVNQSDKMNKIQDMLTNFIRQKLFKFRQNASMIKWYGKPAQSQLSCMTTDNVILTILLCTFWLKYAELKYTETVLFTSEGHITIQIFIVLP